MSCHLLRKTVFEMSFLWPFSAAVKSRVTSMMSAKRLCLRYHLNIENSCDLDTTSGSRKSSSYWSGTSECWGPCAQEYCCSGKNNYTYLDIFELILCNVHSDLVDDTFGSLSILQGRVLVVLPFWYRKEKTRQYHFHIRFHLSIFLCMSIARRLSFSQ